MVLLEGTGVSHGIAIGRALVLGRWELGVAHYLVDESEVRTELRRFLRARRQAREEIEALREQTAVRLGEKYAAIFQAHRMILDDRKLGRLTMNRVREGKRNVEWALASTVNDFLEQLGAVEDPYFRDRCGDLSDVHERLQRILAGQENRHARPLAVAEETVVVAHDLSPSDATWLHQPNVVGFVTEEGGTTSHTAILAAALEIPAVLGTDEAATRIETGDVVVVDGTRGQVIARPSATTLERLRSVQIAVKRVERSLEEEKGPVLTRDGVSVRIAANIEFPEEMETVRRVGAEGVGLYRTEFLFLAAAPALPSEEDHIAAYRTVAESADGATVLIRTPDLGGEKYFHGVLGGGEANPVLGLRAVRFCLARPDIFRVQLRGLLRVAGEFSNVNILVPMITGLEEWRAVRALVEDVGNELRSEGFHVPEVPLGCMIEVPSAAVIADLLAREASFFSIGTNDLVQYALAVDRGNRQVAHLSDPWHPAVLRMIRGTIEAAETAGIPVSLCGELASDPLGTLTLLGLGLRFVSCNPVAVPEVRKLIRAASIEDVAAAGQSALALETGREIRSFLAAHFQPLIDETLGPALSPFRHDQSIRRNGAPETGPAPDETT